LIVGIFSPVINWCGGAEWVAVSIINALKERGHQVVLLSNKPLDQEKFKRIFNRTVSVDQQIIFPFAFFGPTDFKNVYTDSIRSLMLKSKCQVVVDTFSNAMLPGTSVSYVHHPLLRLVEVGTPYARNKLYFLPYQTYLRFYKENFTKRLVLANSKFTAQAVKAETGVDPYVLYPPVMNEIDPEERAFERKRENNVITVGRICRGKNLCIIPYLAKLTRKDICFTIAGILESQAVMLSLLKLTKELNISDRVRILTNVKREDLKSILLNSKVYLHTKVNEPFGISIVEAMTLGCTPVVPDSGGPKEFVPQSQRYKTLEEAAEKIEKAIDQWTSIQARKISTNTDKFSEQSFTKQFIDIFSSHLNEGLA
jgi:glycosyltransferase involved in cell wall biosynthesis